MTVKEILNERGCLNISEISNEFLEKEGTKNTRVLIQGIVTKIVFEGGIIDFFENEKRAYVKMQKELGPFALSLNEYLDMVQVIVNEFKE